MTFIFMGNRPKPGGIDSTKYTKEHYIKIITSIDADKEECNNRIFYEKTEALAGYMNSLDRAEIASKEELVLKTGLYIFKCHGDNHTFVELHEMTKGEKLWKYYMNIELDGWTVIKPFKYHIVSDTEIGIVKENWDVLRKMG